MKKILIISACGKRRNTIGLIGGLLSHLSKLDKKKFNISLLDTDFFERNHNPQDYPVNYYSLNICWYDDIIRKIPRFRAYYANKAAVRTYRRLLKDNHYNIVLVFQIPIYADQLVKIAHEYNAKILFQPFGSDILRVSERIKQKFKNAFADVDGVCGYEKSGTLNAATDVYNVASDKLKIQKLYLEGVKRISDFRGKFSRNEMMKSLKIPYSEYNIVCGYSGRTSHRHRVIIDALIKEKFFLPNGYQIIFPMTYGAGPHHEIILNYAAQLKELCDSVGLNAVFLTEFMSIDEIAYLHLITDLFIEIQPTDNGNAFMMESLFAENKIVTGRWLNYKNFEQYGMPYYLIDSPDDLPEMLHDIFTHNTTSIKIPQALLKQFSVTDEDEPSCFWEKLFDSM